MIYSTVDCVTEHESIQEGYDLDGGWSASVKLRCNWSERHLLVADIFGNHREYPGLSGFGLQAQSAAIVPEKECYTESGQGMVYTTALVTFNYGTKVTDLISESLEPTAEFLTLDHKRFRWGAAGGDPLLEGEAPGKLLRGMNIVRTLYELPSIPVAVGTSVGKCNSGAYVSTLLGLTFPIETLLYQPPNMDRTIKSDGAAAWKLTMKFAFKPEGWNKYWRAKTQTYEKIFLVDGAEYKSYTPGDFSTLLF